MFNNDNQNEKNYDNTNYNVQNGNLNQPWQTMNNNLSQPSYNNELNNYNVETKEDLPPDLDEIKNLNEATIASAPTMDALDPMNIMPDKLQTNNDLLDAYENGNLNVNSNNFNGNPLNNQNVLNNFANNDYNSINNNLNINNNYSTNDNLNNQFYNNLNLTQPLNSPINSLDNNQKLVSDYEINNDLINTNININNDTLVKDLPTTSQTVDNQNNDLNPILDEQKDLLIDESYEKTEDIPKDENDETGEQENVIENKTPNLSDLGLDESYNEPDTLEIMDFDSEIEEENENTKTDQKPVSSGLVSDNVEKIKALISELKANGVDIEFEEFDFESMYQLIIKLKK